MGNAALPRAGTYAATHDQTTFSVRNSRLGLRVGAPVDLLLPIIPPRPPPRTTTPSLQSFLLSLQDWLPGDSASRPGLRWGAHRPGTTRRCAPKDCASSVDARGGAPNG